MIPVIKVIFLMETLLLAKKLSENKLIKRPKRDVYIQSTEAGKIGNFTNAYIFRFSNKDIHLNSQI